MMAGLTPAQRLHEAMRALGRAPDRRLGQNFLIDPSVIDRIAATVAPGPGEPIVEVGPGLGFLTEALLGRGARVLALERDDQLAATLAQHIGPLPAGELCPVLADALTPPIRATSCERPAPRWCGNLPYHIAVELIVTLALEQRARGACPFLVQREVAERLVAGPGCRERGAPSIVLQARARVRRCFDVSPHCFRPRPKVVSTLIEVTYEGRRPSHLLEDPLAPERAAAFDRHYDRVVAAAFRHRRKVIPTALTRSGFAQREVARRAARQAGVAHLRAQDLDLVQFARLARYLDPEPAPDKEPPP